MKFETCTERALLYGAFESPYQQSHSLRRPFYTDRTALFGLDGGSLGFCGVFSHVANAVYRRCFFSHRLSPFLFLSFSSPSSLIFASVASVFLFSHPPEPFRTMSDV
jgi:hypothetical protein